MILVAIEVGKLFFKPSKFIIIAPSQFILISGGLMPEEIQTYWSNWLEEQASIEKWAELCVLGAISLINRPFTP